MAYFNRDNRPGGKGFGKKNFRRNFGENRGFGGGQGKPFMHKATCAECGKEAEVPFKPTGDRPIYCSNCFEKRGNSRPNNSFRSEKPRYIENNNRPPQIESGGYKQYKEQFDLINSKLDSIIKALTSISSEPQGVAVKEVKNVKKIKTGITKSKAPLKTKKKKVKA